MKKTRRTSQLGEVIRAEVAAILREELRDESLGFVTVTEVEVSTDMRYARVFVSTLGDEAEIERNVEILNDAKKAIRHHLARRARLRYTPELDFRADMTTLRAGSIETILREVLPHEPATNEEKEEKEEKGE
ncbi:MAG TPA: 30S ribosome-binding factor RbfA [Thermoanaerobaculia bacterium]|nr:30S ribosome-binding factor RbfA [Thermoanaerobaculia bacterium]